MLTEYFKSRLALGRFRSGRFGPHLDAFTDWLASCGYHHASIRRHVREVVHVGVWADTEGITGCGLNRTALQRFEDYLADKGLLRDRCNGHRHPYKSACVFVDFLEATGLERRITPRAIPTMCQADVLWNEFAEWMASQRGTMASTLANYRLPVMALLQSLGTDASAFTAEGLRSFLLGQVMQSSQVQSKTLATALRMFLRFLIARGDCPIGLNYAIPTVARWRLATLPKYLASMDVERLIQSCDTDSALGLRDRAILLLIARLGLRAGDVSALRFCDFHWTESQIIVAGKNRREARLPIPQDVGDAVLSYLRHARPHVLSDNIFITVTAPNAPISRQSVSKAVFRAIRRTRINAPSKGAHLLRHSAATGLLRDGVSLPAIGALLRHASIETTTVYAKVDTGLLSKVVMPWPEAQSC